MPGSQPITSNLYWALLQLAVIPPSPDPEESPQPYLLFQYAAWNSADEYRQAWHRGQCVISPIQGQVAEPVRLWGPLVAQIAAQGLTHPLGNAAVRRALTADASDQELWATTEGGELAYCSGVRECRAKMLGVPMELGDGGDDFEIAAAPTPAAVAAYAESEEGEE